MSILRKFVKAAQGIGYGNAFLLAASRILPRLFGGNVRIFKYYFMAQPVSGLGSSRQRGQAFELHWVDKGWPLFSQVERPGFVIASRYAQGARCLAAVANGSELAGFLWFTYGPYEEDEVRARFCPEPDGATAWDFDVWVRPRYRMSRLLSYLWSAAATELADRGITATISRISAFNLESIASHRRMGGRVVGNAVFLCIGHWQLTRSSMRPRWHLSRRHDRRPEFHVTAGKPPTGDAAGAWGVR